MISYIYDLQIYIVVLERFLLYDLQIYIVVLERFLLKVRVQIGSWVHLNPVFCVKSLRKMILCKEKSFSFLGEAVWQ